MPNFSHMSDAELSAWITNFTSVVGASPADYGLTAAQVTDLNNYNADLQTKMTERVAVDEAAKAAKAAQQAVRQAVAPVCSYYNTIIKADPNISDAAKVAAGIDSRKASVSTPPTTPTGLVVNGYENGVNVLKWDRAGNKPNTQFIVEYRESAETGFVFLAATTETTYKQTGANPGTQCAYRVKAQRAGQESTYSNTAVVYMA